MKEDMNLIRNNTYQNDILFIDGNGNSGKALFMRILECFDGVEKSQELDYIYTILELYRLRKLTEDATIVFLKSFLDREIYNQMMSREINFKFSDTTSVFRYPYPLEYIKRLFYNDREKVNNLIKTENPMYLTGTQNALGSSEILFKTFGDRLKIAYINRNPIDIIYNLWKRGFLARLGTHPTNIRLCYDYDGLSIPTFESDFKEYDTKSELDKLIDMVYFYTKLDFNGYNDNKKKVLVLDFDDMMTKPIDECESIEKFINRESSDRLYGILRKEKCPRDMTKIAKLRTHQQYEIKSHINKASVYKLDELISLKWKK